MIRDITRTIAILVIAAGLAACGETSSTPEDNLGILGDVCDGTGSIIQCEAGLVCSNSGVCQDPGTPGVIGDAEADEPCDGTDDCGYGLVCNVDGVCEEDGVAGEGEGCGSSEECTLGLVCDSTYRCSEPGDGIVNSPCDGAEDCHESYVCAGDGTCQDPADGTVAGPGEECDTTADCRMGLFCTCLPDCQCLGPQFWQGTGCGEVAGDADPFKVYFEIPEGADTAEFYRLPFPNNIRYRGGNIDMSGHAVPETPLAEGIVGTYLDAIEHDVPGFSTQAAVYFRFNKSPDFATVELSGADKNFYLVDIDPDSPDYGSTSFAVSMAAVSGPGSQGKYICQNWMALKPTDGYPLRHDTTYAVLLEDGIHSERGTALVRDDDFEAMLSDTAPASGVLLEAWEEYQPLRDYLVDTDVADPTLAGRLMAATVYTTMDPDAVMAGFRDKVRDCAGEGCDLLPDAAPNDMALDSETDDYWVLTGTVGMPVFQEGSPPYLADGGGVEFDAEDRPIIQAQMPVDYTLTVPKGTPPAEGWPVVIFAHGTGGSSASALGNGVADNLASVDVTIDTATSTVQFAVLGIEGVQHGTRRGDSDLEPDVLYFNFVNPYSAKYNAVQGAADNFQIVRMIESLHDAPFTVGGVGEPVQLDSSQVYYFGHSQGCLTGPLFLEYEPAVRAAVLSGAGGNLIQSLLTKTQPLDIAGLTRLALADSSVDDKHPMLNLFQLFFDQIDVVNYARGLTFRSAQVGETTDDPPEPIYGAPLHVFMSYGRNDHYATEKTQLAFSRPLGARQVNDLGLSCNCHNGCDTREEGEYTNLCLVGGLIETTTPSRAEDYNSTSSEWFTAILKMYMPDGYDGHFVLFDHPDGPSDYSRFLASAVADPEGIPTFFP